MVAGPIPQMPHQGLGESIDAARSEAFTGRGEEHREEARVLFEASQMVRDLVDECLELAWRSQLLGDVHWVSQAAREFRERLEAQGMALREQVANQLDEGAQLLFEAGWALSVVDPNYVGGP